MAQVVNVNANGLIMAAATVAEHLAGAATPPTGALPPAAAPSLADVAAAQAAGAIRTRIAAVSTELAGKGPAAARRDHGCRGHLAGPRRGECGPDSGGEPAAASRLTAATSSRAADQAMTCRRTTQEVLRLVAQPEPRRKDPGLQLRP